MDTKNAQAEQLDTKQEEDYYEGNSKKRPKKFHPFLTKILVFIIIILSLSCLHLIYLLNSKKTESFLELAESRFSLRHYSQKPVEPEKISKLLRVAQVAPNGREFTTSKDIYNYKRKG